jgi:hypothetical protein
MPVITGFICSRADVPDVNGAPGWRSASDDDNGRFKLLKKPRPGLLPVDVLLLNRNSPPNFVAVFAAAEAERVAVGPK